MSALEEVKGRFDATEKTLHDLRQKVEELEGKAKDVVDQDVLRKAKDELAARFEQEQKASEELKERVASLEAKGNRLGATGPEGDELERKLFNDYLRGHVDERELKTAQVAVAADGGFAVIPTMDSVIQERLRRSSPVRQVANIVTISGSEYQMLVERGDTGADWVGEATPVSETATPTLNRISINLHEMRAAPEATQRILDDAMFDVEAFLVNQIGDKFSRAEATAFVTGDGVIRPKGFTQYATAATEDESRANQTLQYAVTGASGALNSTNPGDVFRELYYEMNPAYLANAVWMARSKTLAEIAVIKDASGYLMRGLLNGEGGLIRTIEGAPVVSAHDMPAIGANSLSVALGDFRAGYTIVEKGGVSLLRDPFSAKPNVIFFATKRVGGGVTNFDAIKFVKFGTA